MLARMTIHSEQAMINAPMRMIHGTNCDNVANPEKCGSVDSGLIGVDCDNLSDRFSDRPYHWLKTIIP